MAFAAAVNAFPRTRRALTLDEIARVVGGTFTPNTYSESTYNLVGISTCYHPFSKDEFFFNGKSISYDQANAIVKLANIVYNTLNSGNHGANMIGYHEPAFIRAFNSQLRLKMGLVWDGTSGRSF